MAKRARAQSETTNGSGAAAPPAAGHNGAGLSEDQFFEAKREIESLERQKNSVVGKLREARKEWKTKGLDLKIFDLTRKLAAYTAPELEHDLNRTIAYAKFLKLPIYSQLDMFHAETEVTDEDRLEDARARGLVAGKSGAERNCPWPQETPMGNAWLNAFDEGQATLQSQVGRGA
jgi:ribosome modulation factor